MIEQSSCDDSRIRRTFVASLLTLHAALLLGNARWNFITYDEIVHVPAGLSNWHIGRFSLARVNPPLARMLATLPVLLANPKTDYHRFLDTQGRRQEWEVGNDFLAANGERTFDLIRLARLAGIGWSLLGGCLIYLWARELYGSTGGCLALALWCFDPNVLAHAPLATADLPATVASLGAVYAFRKYLQAPHWRVAVIAGFALGVAQLTKYTMILLYGILPLWWVFDRLRRQGPGKWRTLGHASLVVLVSLYVLNLGYGFEDSGRALKDYTFISRVFTGSGHAEDSSPDGRPPGNRFRATWLGEARVPLPANYLRGIDVQRKDFEGAFQSYLNGTWSDRGWWYYYLEAFVIKEPLGFMILVMWGLGRAMLRRPGAAHPAEELGLVISALTYLVFVSSQTGFNHHMRYVLPMLPFLIVGSGKLGWFFRPGHLKAAGIVVVLGTWGIASSLMVYPCSLSYFNEAAGGPLAGHAYLVDSNIDWGQDLLRLRDWLRSHPEARPFHLAYFNSVAPELFGIDYRLPPMRPPRGPVSGGSGSDGPQGPLPGYHAISVNFLRGMIHGARNGAGNSGLASRHDAYTYFLQFRPIARAGYSIYIYHITEAEANDARRRMGLPPPGTDQASSRTVQGKATGGE